MEHVKKCYVRKGFSFQDLSGKHLANYLVTLFKDGRSPWTLGVHKAAINSVLEEYGKISDSERKTLSKIVAAMKLARPRTTTFAPPWDLSLVLESLLKYPFCRGNSDKKISLQWLTKKTVFLVALATGSRASELAALSRHPDFITWDFQNGVASVAVTPFAGFLAKNALPEIAPESFSIQGIAHLNPKGSVDQKKRLLCPVRALALFLEKSETVRNPQDKLFIHWDEAVSTTTSHISLWMVDVIRAAYEAAGKDPPNGLRGHQTRSLATSWAYASHIPLEKIMTAVRWRSKSVFSRHYLRQVSKDEEGNFKLPVVLAGSSVNL